MNKQGQEERKNVFQFSFLKEGAAGPPFLKQESDLYANFMGCRLDKLISLNSNEMNGLLFTREEITENFKSNKNKNISFSILETKQFYFTKKFR